MLRPLLLCLLLASLLHASPTTAPIEPWLHEQSQTWTTQGDSVRINLNTPDDVSPAKPMQLIIFSLPNGNTIEQTLGCKLAPGMHWRYDIQHIVAQTRLLRQLDHEHNIILACVEAKGLSWPAWRKERKDNGHQIRTIVREIAQKCRPAPTSIGLAGHSGGGSFIFGYINGGADIDADVSRIAFLDANYAYDESEHHGDKLLRWLKGDASRRLVTIAYDDRDVTFNGKKIVSETGGTYRSSHRMIDHLKAASAPAGMPNIEHFAAMNGQIEFFIHTNPDKKILHTRLVELNGFLFAMTLGTPLNKGIAFFSDRAYSAFIQPPPPTAASQATTLPSITAIPSRATNAMGGRAFMKQIDALPLVQREGAIAKEILGGNIPPFLRNWVDVKLEAQALDGRSHTVVIHVMPDYLAIGSDDDFVRIPITPNTATLIAQKLNCTLVTRKISDAVYQQAAVKLEPRPLTEKREAVATFVQHNQIIEDQLAADPKRQLIAGIKKDVVLTPVLKEKPKKVAIYGWHKPDGKPIQPLYTGHADFYVDYSHGIRLVAGTCVVDGVERSVAEVLKDPQWCALLSDEGPVDFSYPTAVRPPPNQ
ncbi:MAG TPA: hypothetical protein VF669_09075 [Tepidisphaeraceae bacterium]